MGDHDSYSDKFGFRIFLINLSSFAFFARDLPIFGCGSASLARTAPSPKAASQGRVAPRACASIAERLKDR